MTQPRAMIDRLSRFFRVRRSAFRIAATAVAAVIVLELVALAAWWSYSRWRLGHITLTNEGPPLVVQVLDESGEHPIGQPFDLVTESTLALPDGDYRLRVDGVGRLGQTDRMAVSRGETIEHKLSLDEGRPLAGDRPKAPREVKRVGLDPTTGRPEGPPGVFGFVPVREIQYADLDGVGEPDVLALGPGPTKPQQSLTAFSSATGRTLWTTTVNARFMSRETFHLPSEWPWLVDLDGDGRTEVAVPDSGPMPPGGGYRGVRMFDGATGRTRWVRPMCPDTDENDELAHLGAAPDLDGDGTRDLVAVSLFKGRRPPPAEPWDIYERGRVYVDALSGKDGHPLWSWTREHPTDRSCFTWPLRWWGRGPDGWPLLAVSIGGQPPPELQEVFTGSSLARPVVHILEGSTGQERHTIPGLYRPEAADLDGDGLDDLWGEVEGHLRVFRGRAPEAWRALGGYKPAGDAPSLRPPRDSASIDWSTPRPDSTRFRGGADMDGDGIGDALLSEVFPPHEAWRRLTGSRTAIARSGRDGHILWKTVLDPPPIWDDRDRDRGGPYELSSFPLPDGDLDGDGTADVIVTRPAWAFETEETRKPSALPLQALSGRTGRRLWSAGPLPAGAAPYGRARIERGDMPRSLRIDSHGAADVVVLYGTPEMLPGYQSVDIQALTQHRLAWFSGRDGRVVRDIPLAQSEPMWPGSAYGVPPLDIPLLHFGDLDGDGSLDAVFVHSPARGGTLSLGSSQRDIEVKAVSLGRGETLWSRRFPIPNSGRHQLLLEVGDLDGDRRAEVLVASAIAGEERDRAVSELNAFDGPDGRVLWAWRGRPTHSEDLLELCLVRVDGRRKAPCLAVGHSEACRRLFMLDTRGRETAERELPLPAVCTLETADLDGDGSDELLLTSKEGLRVLGPDLKETGLQQPLTDPEGWWYLPAASGRPGALILPPVPVAAGSGANHQPARFLLDRGDEAGARRPLWTVGTLDSTVCRFALPVLSTGRSAPPRGTPVPSGLARDDPRWARPLPWIQPIRHTFGPRSFLAAIGLALVNVIVPIGILRLAARRRPWSLRLLMAMPVAAALPLSVFQARESLLPDQIGTLPASARPVFALATLAGLPIVLYAGMAVASLFRRRWRHLVALLALTIVASTVVGVAWLRLDGRTMPAIEHYDRTNGYLIAVPGAYAVGILLLMAWILRGPYRWIRRIRRPEAGTP
jgi:hypothetical protein